MFSKTNGIFYSYFLLIGDQDEADKYKVTMMAGNGGQTEKTHRDGKVFPIDAQESSIIKEKNGVLSFQRGTGDLFEDQDDEGQAVAKRKKVYMRFEISNVATASSRPPVYSD